MCAIWEQNMVFDALWSTLMARPMFPIALGQCLADPMLSNSRFEYIRNYVNISARVNKTVVGGRGPGHESAPLTLLILPCLSPSLFLFLPASLTLLIPPCPPHSSHSSLSPSLFSFLPACPPLYQVSTPPDLRDVIIFPKFTLDSLVMRMPNCRGEWPEMLGVCQGGGGGGVE